MHEQANLADVTFTENTAVDAAQLNDLYRLIGWDRAHRRTDAETIEMLRVSHYYIAAHTAHGTLIGFARVSGDPYVVQASMNGSGFTSSRMRRWHGSGRHS